MLGPDSAGYFYDQLIKIKENDQLTLYLRYLESYQIFKDIFQKVTENEIQFFSSSFSRTFYAIDKYKVDDHLANQIKETRILLINVKQNQHYEVSERELFSLIAVLTRIVRFFSNLEAPDELLHIIRDFEFSSTHEYSFEDSRKIDFLKCIIRDRKIYNPESQYCVLEVEAEHFGNINIQLSGKWSEIGQYIWKGANIAFHHLLIKSGEELVLANMNDSIVVIEPDYLIDVTEISECFQQRVNVNLYFLKRFTGTPYSFSMLLGNIVNYFFDVLIEDPNAVFDDLYNQALRQKPLQIVALAKHIPDSLKFLRGTAAKHFWALKRELQELEFDSLYIEPSFLSPEYGLQGRLDAMLEYDNDRSKHDIIELKSGSAPRIYHNNSMDKNPQQMALWPNHLAQTTCYNLLLDSTFENRSGSSMMLYSKAEHSPFRDAPNLLSKKQEVIFNRNIIVALERAIILGNYNIYSNIHQHKFGPHPSYDAEHINDFQSYYENASSIEKKYFQVFSSFLFREVYSEKLGEDGDNRRRGFSSFWLDSALEKENKNALMRNLYFDSERSDLDHLHLYFQIDRSQNSNSNFRLGDIVILYPQNGEVKSPTKQQLIKGSIREYSKDHVLISLRNKQINRALLLNEEWAIEADYIDANNKRLFRSLYSFLSADKKKKSLLLGIREPEFADLRINEYPELNPTQKHLLQSAAAAEDYYIIQGPPGTGKTSYMLKSLIHYLYNNSDDDLLIMAYTNRAVDEIGNAIKKIEPKIPFLRLGSKESSIHKDELISNLASKHTLNELYTKVDECRIILSTVASIHSNPEIMDIKNFKVAIIDEASQILEPQIIGILSKVEKFIMIGDEKQLPAVVTQPEVMNKIGDDELEEINLLDLRSSFFERLLRCCKSNNWNNAYGLLDMQARMHKDIQEFPNQAFYSGQLKTFDNSWQEDEIQRFKRDSNNPLERILAKHRVIFIDSDYERAGKIHHQEADRISQISKMIANVYAEDFNENTIGVISPFRAQCSEIRKNIDDSISEIVSVDTVERFQGSERDIMLLSFAVNHEMQLEQIQSIIEIDDCQVDRKLNVALTRAKQHILVLGNSDVLNHSDLYKKFIEYIRDNGLSLSSKEFEEISG